MNPAQTMAAPSGTVLGVLMPPERPETILGEAERLVYGDRQASYGHPYDDYTRTARMWEAILGMSPYTISPSVACLMMAAVKISREVNKPKRDNLVDLAGYAACAQRCAERQAELDVPQTDAMDARGAA